METKAIRGSVYEMLSMTSVMKRPKEENEDPPSIKVFLLIALTSLTLFLISVSHSIKHLIPLSISSAVTIIVLSVSVIKLFL
ncbi:hypothetical protein LWI29_000939 [Acer saccharum]|uniref:Transmembrane protein n=1 Tax=Acer saccharum TaxID=4024 RepID=A0AA39S7F0_ACESA|nr:hypothetical protein LWI29_000939 [Acer saccharum]